MLRYEDLKRRIDGREGGFRLEIRSGWIKQIFGRDSGRTMNGGVRKKGTLDKKVEPRIRMEYQVKWETLVACVTVIPRRLAHLKHPFVFFLFLFLFSFTRENSGRVHFSAISISRLELPIYKVAKKRKF